MESKQLKDNSVENALKSIDKWYIRNGVAITNSMRFDIKSKVSTSRIKIMLALERILKTNLSCDLEISAEFLEKVKKCTNGVH